VTLIPYVDNATAFTNADVGKDVFKWVCGLAPSTSMPSKYLPGSCRGQ